MLRLFWGGNTIIASENAWDTWIITPQTGRNQMNHTLELLLNRKSVRAYEDKLIDDSERDKILTAVLRAPTAGNMMLYSIIEVTDQKTKETLARTCDNQPFIAKAPWVLLFLADYQKWFDTYNVSGIVEICAQKEETLRVPQEGDLFLACCDALIAAQTAVIAAESLGIGSCYIGDIMENYETHRELFDLPRFVFPIAMTCFGYPTRQQRERKQTLRFDRRFVVFENRYQRLCKVDFDEMYRERAEQMLAGRESVRGARNLGQLMYNKKFNSDFAKEMNRSVREILRQWREGEP